MSVSASALSQRQPSSTSCRPQQAAVGVLKGGMTGLRVQHLVRVLLHDASCLQLLTWSLLVPTVMGHSFLDPYHGRLLLQPFIALHADSCAARHNKAFTACLKIGL